MFILDPQSDFKIVYRPVTQPQTGDYLFVYQNSQIGLIADKRLPVLTKTPDLLTSEAVYCFGEIGAHQCLLWTEKINDLEFVDARFSFNFLAKSIYHAIAIGSHVHHWRHTHQFCGLCGSSMTDYATERARLCSQCQHLAYPKISPCVIVLVTRGREFLLARSPHFRPGMMSALAGYIEIGESVEQCVIREVEEEVGIKVKNLKYIASQPWPFPDSLMLGYTAEFDSGELNLDPKEIESAQWYGPDNLPVLPHEMSIARFLIERHLKNLALA